MTTYYPDRQGTGREGITLRDVLQMSSGLEWTEDYDPAAISSSDIIQMVLFHPPMAIASRNCELRSMNTALSSTCSVPTSPSRPSSRGESPALMLGLDQPSRDPRCARPRGSRAGSPFGRG
jgi:hypothetical protein